MPPQQMILGLLDEPKPMGELAQHMHCDSSNITGIVDRLTERGLVERGPAVGDRRVKLVALTEPAASSATSSTAAAPSRRPRSRRSPRRTCDACTGSSPASS